jgi:hypothetical protein
VTLAPSDTPTITPIYLVVTATPTATVVTPPPIVTPPSPPPTSPPPTITPTPAPLAAQVCAACGGLRLRDTPGTAGQIVTMLNAAAAVTVTGRTADTAWLQIRTADGNRLGGGRLPGRAGRSVRAGRGRGSGQLGGDLRPGGGRGRGGRGDAGRPAQRQRGDGHHGRSRQIFLAGQQRGNIFNAFTRIGDSITVSGAFLTELAHPGATTWASTITSRP